MPDCYLSLPSFLLLFSFNLSLTQVFYRKQKDKNTFKAVLYPLEKKLMDSIQARAKVEANTTSPTGKAVGDSEERKQEKIVKENCAAGGKLLN